MFTGMCELELAGVAGECLLQERRDALPISLSDAIEVIGSDEFGFMFAADHLQARSIDRRQTTVRVYGEDLGVLREKAEGVSEIKIGYGAFLNNLIAFLIVAAAIFVVIKIMNRVREQFEAEEKQRKTYDKIAPVLESFLFRECKCKTKADQR